MSNLEKKCVFAGTFDPPTLGHIAIINQCLKMFEKITIALMDNPAKEPCFSLKERLEMLSLSFSKGEKDNRIKIISFSGTAAELLKKEETEIYIRGVRNSSDFNYENENMFLTKKLDNNILPVYIPCEQEMLHISSSAVRALLKFHQPITGYVSKEVEEYIYSLGKFKKKEL